MTEASLGLAGRPPNQLVSVRHGTAADADAAMDLHRRCSPDALMQRFHTPHMRLSPRHMHDLLQPRRGFSLLAWHGEEVLGMACAAEVEPDRLELGMLVRDDWQGRGIGSGLLRGVAAEGAARGYSTLLATTQPDNHGVTAMVARAGLPFTRLVHDGLLEVGISISEQETLPWSA